MTNKCAMFAQLTNVIMMKSVLKGDVKFRDIFLTKNYIFGLGISKFKYDNFKKQNFFTYSV